MRRCKAILAILALTFGIVLVPPVALAQSGGVPNYQVIPDYAGIGAGQQFRTDLNNHLAGVTPIAPRIVTILFAQLPAERDGQEFYLRDGVAGNPCTGGGQGAFAYGVQGQWICSGTAIANTLLESTAACAGPPTIGNLLAVNGLGVWCDTATPAIGAVTLNPAIAQSAINANLHNGATAPLAVLADANANSVQTLLQMNTAGHPAACSMTEQADGSVTVTCSKIVATGNATVGTTLGVTGLATLSGGANLGSSSSFDASGNAALGGALHLTGGFTWNAGAPDLTETNAPRLPLSFFAPLIAGSGQIGITFRYTPSVAMHARLLNIGLGTGATGCSTFPTYEITVGGAGQAASAITLTSGFTGFSSAAFAVAVGANQLLSVQATTLGAGCTGPANANFVIELTTD